MNGNFSCSLIFGCVLHKHSVFCEALLQQLGCVINPISSCFLTALLVAATAGLSSALGAVPSGQTNAPNLNPPSQIDPSSIERAYAALGLTYQGNQIQAQNAQPNMSNQGLQGQAGVRPLNPMGEFGCMFTCLTQDSQAPQGSVCRSRSFNGWFLPDTTNFQKSL